MDADYIIAQRYRVGRKLGEGGMGAVYEAEHVVTGRRMAVKILERRESLPREDVDRFLREARAPAAIGHPNVVEIIDAGTEPDGTAFIVMELLEGEPFDEVLKRDRVVQPAVLAPIMDQLLCALDAMHARGFVHRDLKPANIFLVRGQSAPLVVKLLDFGIAKALGEDSRTRSGYVMGTPAYMAPEQMRNARNATAKSDLWSVGVILYEALAGHRPFRGETFGLLAQIAGPAPAVPLGHVAPHLPRELTELVDLLLSKDVAARPGSAAGVRANLLPMLVRCPPVFPVPAPDLDEPEATPQDALDALGATMRRDVRHGVPPVRHDLVSTRGPYEPAPPPPHHDEGREGGFLRARGVQLGIGAGVLAAVLIVGFMARTSPRPRPAPAAPVPQSTVSSGRGGQPVAANRELDQLLRRWVATVAGSSGRASVASFYAERAAFRAAGTLTPGEIQRQWQGVFAREGSFGIDWDRSQYSEERPDLNLGVSAACINLTGETGRVIKVRAHARELVVDRGPQIPCERLEGEYVIRLRRINSELRICQEGWSREGICASCPAASGCNRAAQP